MLSNVVRAREPSSFWRENEIVFVFLLRVSENVVVAETSYQMLELSIYHFRMKRGLKHLQ